MDLTGSAGTLNRGSVSTTSRLKAGGPQTAPNRSFVLAAATDRSPPFSYSRALAALSRQLLSL